MVASASVPLEIVVAAADNGVIGRDGDLPWKLPADLAHFRRTTLGHTILMGRKTWQSLGRSLPQRQNWVITRDARFDAPGARVFASLDHALATARAEQLGRLMVIGGAQIYAQTLVLAQVLHLTRVHAEVAGDTRLPEFDAGDFVEESHERHPADERNEHAYSFIRLRRRAAD